MSSEEEAWLGFGSDVDAERIALRSAAALAAKTQAARPFPRTAQRVIELTSGTERHVREVVRVIETDPTLATRLLRYVNSAACGLKVRCKSLYHAVTLLGPRRVRDLVTSTAVLSMFERGDEVSLGILEHAAATGALARVVGERFGLPSEEMLACGLLHDLGKLMMLDVGDETYDRLLELADDDETLCTLEREQYGFDHAVLASQLLIQWRIPAPIPRVVAWHHQPGRAHALGGRIALMVEVLRFADAVSDAILRGGAPARELAARVAATPAAAYLGLDDGQMERVWPVLAKVAAESRALFRGEEAPPVDDASLGSRALAARHAEAETEALACGICNEPGYGRSCGGCGRGMCEAHDPALGYCVDCEREFASTADPMTNALVGTTLMGAAAAGLMIVFTGVFEVDLSVGFGAALAGSAASGAAAAARRFLRRKSFRSLEHGPDAEPRPSAAAVAVVPAPVFEAPEVIDPDDTRHVSAADLGSLVHFIGRRPAEDGGDEAPATDRSPAPFALHETIEALEPVDLDGLDSWTDSFRAAEQVAPFRPSRSVPYGEAMEASSSAIPLLRQPRRALASTLPPPAAPTTPGERLAKVG